MKIILATQNKWKLKEFVDISNLKNKLIKFEIKPLKQDIGEVIENGFGYDSMFIPNEYKCVVSEISYKDKNLISHRAKAMNKFIEFIK